MRILRVLATRLAVLAFLLPAAGLAADPVVAQLYGGNLVAALELARAKAADAPGDLDAQELVVDLLVASGQAARAAREAEARVREHPDDPDAHYLLGRARVDPEAAAQAYERALRLDPDHARSHMGMGAIHAAMGRLDEAERAWSEALRRDGSLGEAWLGLVRVQLLRGDHARALDYARRGMAAAPGEAGLVLAAAQLDPPHARELLEAAARTSDDPRVHTRLAELRLAGGEADAATVSARRALAIDPGALDAERVLVYAATIAAGKLDLDGLAELLDARDAASADPAAAVGRLEAFVARYPDAAIGFVALARARQRAGDAEGTFEALALALQRDPDLVDAQAAFGLALVGRDRHAEAIPWLGRALAARPWDPDLARSLGIAQVRGGAPGDGVQTLARAHAARPWDVPTLLAYAEALQANGQPDKAYALVRDALRASADPRLAAAFVVAARAAGHPETAADFLEDLGRKAGSARLVELARQIRAGGP